MGWSSLFDVIFISYIYWQKIATFEYILLFAEKRHFGVYSDILGLGNVKDSTTLFCFNDSSDGFAIFVRTVWLHFAALCLNWKIYLFLVVFHKYYTVELKYFSRSTGEWHIFHYILFTFIKFVYGQVWCNVERFLLYFAKICQFRLIWDNL